MSFATMEHLGGHTCPKTRARFALPKQYVNVKIPVELADEVDKILDKKLLGYRSRAEFVAEAVRDKLIQVKK